MYNPTLTQQLAELFREAGKAHHQAYIKTSGADPEWPLWYADYLLEKLKTLLGVNLTKSKLIYLLVLADKEQTRKAPFADWPTYYAVLFLEYLPLTALKLAA